MSSVPYLLEARNVAKMFRGVQALSNFSLKLPPLAIHGIIGPNGAGKTTLFNCLTGFLRPTTGSITFRGQDITGEPAYRVARMGMVRTFQNIRLFNRSSVRENVKVALQQSFEPGGSRLWQTVLSSPTFRQRERGMDDATDDLLARVGLYERREQVAGSLPYGDQRKLEIARAVALKPRLLLLDEPTAGMNPTESTELLGLLRRLRDELRITIIVIAHDIPLVMNLCERIQVLNFGQLIAEGEPALIRNNPGVIAAYLGATDVR